MAEIRNKNHGGISCREANRLIREYVDGSIRDRDLTRLISHVRDCPSCYNELETNFMVTRTIQYLDNEEEGSFELKPLLEKDMNARQEEVRTRGWMTGLHSVIVFVTIILIALLLLDLTGIFRMGELL